MRLTLEDAQVVDRLLDGDGQLDSNAEMPERMQAAQQLLHLLDALPAIDPSTHLIDLTLQRVEDAAQRVPAMGGTQPGEFTPPTGLHAS